ncbi:MAG TPA: plastocyanin/azurin family copper-binding protein [Gemmatimonadaceae bacterium]|jgi:plastocyanin
MMHKKHVGMLFTVAAMLSLAGCSSDKKETPGSDTAATSSETPSSAATGDTILIEMWTDGTGNYFRPNKVEAHPGDVLRYVLKAGVHNVHFLPDSNRIKTGLPAASEMLQLPEQTYDLVVSMAPGEYYFQCDPHAALGMKGELEVEED